MKPRQHGPLHMSGFYLLSLKFVNKTCFISVSIYAVHNLIQNRDVSSKLVIKEMYVPALQRVGCMYRSPAEMKHEQDKAYIDLLTNTSLLSGNDF